jgi:hypothetical protein
VNDTTVNSNGRSAFWRCDRIASVVLLVLAAGVIWQALRLPLGTLGEPGPAAWPLLLAVLLGLLSVAVFIAGGHSQLFSSLQWGEKRHALALLGAACFAAATLETLGFRLCIFLILLFLIGVVERRRVLPTLATALTLSFGAFYLFTHWLKTPLPIGLLGL